MTGLGTSRRAAHQVRRRLPGMVVVASAVVAASGVATESIAWADPVGSDVGQTGDTGASPDSNPHRYCFGGDFNGDLQGFAHDSMNLTDANSDMNAQFEGCNWSGDFTDIHFRNIDLPGTNRGQTPCTWPDPFNFPTTPDCDRYDVNIDRGFIEADANANGQSVENNLRKTVCHEIGHSMGLTHYKVAAFPNPPDGQHDCMVSGIVNDNAGWRYYGSHHKNHINNEF